MYGNWQDAGNGHGWWMLLIMGFVALALIVGLGIFLFTRYGSTGSNAAEPSRDKAVEVLRERFAQGKIEEDEFRSRLALLTGPAEPAP